MPDGTGSTLDLTIVVPARDEAENVKPLLDAIEESLRDAGLAYEVIFVDDGSEDGTQTRLEALYERERRVSVIALRRSCGKAAALAAGFAAARGRFVATLDADLQDDPAELPRLVSRIREGYDLAVGWRVRRRDTLGKRFASRGFNLLLRLATGIGLHDFNCGLKAMRAEVARDLEARLLGEHHRMIPVIAAQRGFRICEVEVVHRERRAGRSKYGSERYLRGLLDLLTVLFLGRFERRPAHFFGGLGVAIGVVGALVLAYLTWLKVATGTLQSRYPLLALGVLLVIVGFQLLTAGLIAELVARREGPEGRRPPVRKVLRRDEAGPVRDAADARRGDGGA